MENLLDLEPVHERIVKLGLNLDISLTLIPTHPSTEEKKMKQPKNNLIVLWRKVRDAVLNYDMKKVLEDFIAKFGKGPDLYPACGGQRLTAKQSMMENEW
jgi:hypothetical protein